MFRPVYDTCARTCSPVHHHWRRQKIANNGKCDNLIEMYCLFVCAKKKMEKQITLWSILLFPVKCVCTWVSGPASTSLSHPPLPLTSNCSCHHIIFFLFTPEDLNAKFLVQKWQTIANHCFQKSFTVIQTPALNCIFTPFLLFSLDSGNIFFNFYIYFCFCFYTKTRRCSCR